MQSKNHCMVITPCRARHNYKSHKLKEGPPRDLSNSDIQSWLASSIPHADLDEQALPEEQPWRRDHVFQHWQNSMQIARTRLLSSSTKVRFQFLRQDLLWLANEAVSLYTAPIRTVYANVFLGIDLSLTQAMVVFELPSQAYPRHINTASRDAVEAIGMRLIEGDGSAQATEIFLLLNWTCSLYTTYLGSSANLVASDSWHVLIGILSALLDMQLNRSTRKRPTLQNSALVPTRRALRFAPALLPIIMAALVTQAKAARTPLAYISLLSTAVDVTIRLKISMTSLSGKCPNLSSNPIVRTGALAFCKVLLTKVPSESLESIASDVLPLTGKTTGLAISLPTLMVNETNDIATSIPHTNASRTPDTSPEAKYGRTYRHNEHGIANPSGTAAGPLEGYVALAVLLGPVGKSGKFDDVVSRSTCADILVGTSRKPSFLIRDKVYLNINEPEKELIQLGSVFVHLSVHSHSSDVRRKAIQTLEVTASRFPQLLNILLRDALMFSLTRPGVPSKPPASAVTTVSPSGQEQDKPAAGNGVGGALRDSLLVDLVVLAHHPMICVPSRLLWIELCQRAGADPHHLVSSNMGKNALETSIVDAKIGGLEENYYQVYLRNFDDDDEISRTLNESCSYT
ncbi:hypothetical protein BU15DRAFT_67476 [Melanogaster broomeanus]|nr:hypothetical protein BU15DRAFT_67476 [Melanogaster broomeanus]